MKIRQLETSLNDAERISEESTDESGNWWSQKIMIESHLLPFELSKTCEVNIAAESSFEASCNKSFVEAFDSIFLHDVFAWSDCVVEEVVVRVETLQPSGRNHEGHFDVFEGLQHDGGDSPAYQPVNTILINH